MEPLEYREFLDLASYTEWFRKYFDQGRNYVEMVVPNDDPRRKAKTVKVYLPHPERDYELLDNILSTSDYDGRWAIKPVLNLLEYRDATDHNTYRVALRKKLFAQYKRHMKEGAFFPFLVFDAKRGIWLSGRHRTEAGKDIFGAFYAVVFNDLTDEEALAIADITNSWHAESWSSDERALLALDYVKVKGWTQTEALEYVGLDPKERNWLLGAMLYKQHDQTPNNRPLLETHKEGRGGGHPRELKSLGELVRVFGTDSIEKYPLSRWLFILNDPNAKEVMALRRSRTNSVKRGAIADLIVQVSGMEAHVDSGYSAWTFAGKSCEDKWRSFMKLVKVVKASGLTKKAGVTRVEDDRVWMSFVFKFTSFTDDGLEIIKDELSDTELEQTNELLGRLIKVFKD